MKKLLILVLAFVLCFAAFTSCVVPSEPDNGDNSGDNDGGNNDGGNTGDNTGDNDGGNDDGREPTVSEDLQAAIDYVWSMYKDELTESIFNFDRTSVVVIAGTKYAVEWTTNSDAVTVEKKNNSTVTIVVPGCEEDLNYTLTATIKDSNGAVVSKSFDYKVPAFTVSTYDQYMAAEADTVVVVDGIVVAINSKSTGSKRNHLFLADASGKGGYYSYQMDEDPIKDLGIEVGMTVRVQGPITPYGGMQEIKGGKAGILNSEKTEYAAVDITDVVKAGNSIIDYVALPVIIKGVTIGGQELEKDTSQYLRFTVGNFSSYIRTYLTDLPNPLNADSKAAIDALHAEHYGDTADVTGILIFYNADTPYLIPTSVDCFYNFVEVQQTPEQKIAAEINELTFESSFKADKEFEIATTGKYFSEVVLSWAADNAAITFENGVAKVVVPYGETTVKVTVTATCEGVSDSKEFTVKLSKVVIPAPVVGSEYFFGFDNAGVKQYLDGANAGGKDFRWNLTPDASSAAKFILEDAGDGKFYVTFMREGVKTYLNIVKNGDYTNLLAGDTGISKWVWDTSICALVVDVDGTIYVPKNYNNYTNVEAKTLDYTNGATFNLTFYAASADSDAFAPVAGTEYFFGFDNEGVKQYLDGANAGGKNFRWNLTSDASLAAKFILEDAGDGKFYVTFMREGVKTYLNIVKNGDYTNLLAGDTGVSKWAWDASLGALVVDVDGTIYVPKNYNNYTNVEAKSLDYTNNATFNLTLIAIEEESDAPVAGTEYFFGFENEGVKQYLDGENSGGKNFRWNLTPDASSAAKFILEDAGDGKFYVTFMKEGVKTYLNIVKSGDYTNLLADAEGKSKWAWDASLGALVVDVDGTIYVPKNYNNYTNVEAKSLDYTNGATFNLTLLAVETSGGSTPEVPETPETPDTPATAPVAGTEYFFGFDNAGAKQYLDGANAGGKNFRWNLTPDASSAAKFILEDAGDGKFYVTFMKEGVKTYLNIVKNGDYTNLLADAEGKSKWAWDASLGALVVDVDGTIYVPKNYNNYTNVEAKTLDYTNGATFNLTLLAVETSGGSTPEVPETPETPEVPEAPEAGTVTVSIADLAAAEKWADATPYTEISLNKYIAVKTSGTPVGNYGLNTGKYYVSNFSWRIYQNESPSIVFEAAEGKTIVSIKVTYSVKNSGTLTFNGANVATDTVVEVNASSATFSVGNTGTKTNGQAQITAIEVTYK